MNPLDAIEKERGVLQRLAGRLSRACKAWRRRQRELATMRELDGLDEHTLKDIGFRREEFLAASEDEEPRKPGRAGAREARLPAKCRCCGALLRGCST